MPLSCRSRAADISWFKERGTHTSTSHRVTQSANGTVESAAALYGTGSARWSRLSSYTASRAWRFMPLAASSSVRGFFWDIRGLCTVSWWCAANWVAPDPVASKGPHALPFLTVEGKCKYEYGCSAARRKDAAQWRLEQKKERLRKRLVGTVYTRAGKGRSDSIPGGSRHSILRTCTRPVPAPVAVLTFLPIVRSPFERYRGINRKTEAPEPSLSKRLSHRTEHMVGPETISLTPRYESGPSPDSYCAPRLAACCRHGSPSKALQLHAWASAAGPGIGMCGTKYWYQYSVPLLSPTHLQGDEDGSNGECPVGQSRLAQQSATRGTRG
ncbi:hypothetical protein N5P37_003492 [Trichoderma harzianum]|nr:hypothetical protein N5P37_003492 [Trichoderma harzianum]